MALAVTSDMASKRTFGEVLNTWVQTSGIIAAGGWAAYAFVYKEITVPNSAPVNVSIALQLKKIGPKSTASEKQTFIAAEMQTAATNPSTREVYVLGSAWIARGCRVDTGPNEESFSTQAEKSLNSPGEGYAEISVRDINYANVVAGRLFADTFLKPNKSVRRTKIFYIPVDRYDEIDLDVRVITTERPQSIALRWKVEFGGLRAVLYRVGKDGKQTEFETDKNGDYLDRDLAKIGLQELHSSSSLSLWQ